MLELKQLAFSRINHYIVDPLTGEISLTKDAPPEAMAAVSKKKWKVSHKLANEGLKRSEYKFLRYFPDTGPLRRELYPRSLLFFAAGKVYRERLFLAANRTSKSDTPASSTRGRDHRRHRSRRPGDTAGRFSGEAGCPRRRSRGGPLQLDVQPKPWHKRHDWLGLSEPEAVTSLAARRERTAVVLPSETEMNRHTLLLAVVLLYAAAFRFIALNRPFEYDLEAASNSQYGVLARNYLRFDLGQTRGIPVLTVSHLPNAPIVFYPDHPPLVPVFIVPFYALFGVGEWQTRLPTSMATVAATYVLYLLLTRFGTRRIGLIAAAVFAATPMTLYFGGFADPVGMLLILFVLLSGIGYLHFHSRPGFLTLIPLVVAFVLAGLCGWPAYVIVPVFLAHFVVTRPRRQWLWIIAFCLTACALFAATYVYIALATDSPWDWMVPLFNRRSPIGTNRFTLTQWLAAALAINGRYHTSPLLVASCIWLVMFGLRTRHAQSSATVALILMAWGILCVLIGGKAAYDHPYLWLPITPGVAIGAALLIERILRRAEHRGLANAANRIVVLFLVLFASWTGYTTFREFYPLKQDRPFAPMELGQAIQAAAPDPSDLVLLVGGEEAEPQLWFYGDRPLRIRVWSIEEFKRRLHDETADLMYDFNVQPWRAAGAGIVFPAVYRRDFENFWAYLQQHYSLVPLPAALADKFDVFDLRRPLAGAP